MWVELKNGFRFDGGESGVQVAKDDWGEGFEWKVGPGVVTCVIFQVAGAWLYAGFCLYMGDNG